MTRLKLLVTAAVVMAAILVHILAPELAGTGLADMLELPSLDAL